MKQTRKIMVSEKVVTAEDLERIARIFDRQATLAHKSGHQASIVYEVKFSDNTTLESDSPELLTDESLSAPARPVAIRMAFDNYSLGRHLSLSLDHGDSTYGNLAVLSGSEADWLGENFLALKDALDRVRPQSFWFRRHQVLLLNLIALGIGSLGMLILDLTLTLLGPRIGLSEIFKPLPADSPWRRAIVSGVPLLYILGWMFRWAAGFLWGAFEVRRWLLSMWPSIEFEFGLAHLRTEQIQRQRLRAVIALIVLPIVTTLIYDLVKAAF